MQTLPEHAPYLTQFIGLKFLSMNINLSWDIWQNKFMEVMENCIPRGTLPERRNLPWLNKSIVQAIKRRNCLYTGNRSVPTILG